jgi:hypothetical protein
MFKQSIAAAAAAVCMMAVASNASAQSAWSPANATVNVNQTGSSAVLFNTVTLNCKPASNTAFQLGTPASGAAFTVTSTANPFVGNGTFTDALLCPTIQLYNQPWAGTVNSGGPSVWNVSLANVRARTTTGTYCEGTLNGTLTEGNSFSVNGTLGSCQVTLNFTLAQSINITP